MQQYFSEEPIEVNGKYYLTKEQAHHAQVVRLDHETVRVVYNGVGYFGTVLKEDGKYVVEITSQDERMNELKQHITLAVALIRKEKFEFVLQKATELGVHTIVPFESSRCVVKVKKEKGDKLYQRWNDIVLTASEQCKRNIVPTITETISMKNLTQIKSECNVAAYENAYGNSQLLSQCFDGKQSITIVIGPEGGFSEQEVVSLQEMGYCPISLGSRILRAETASMYAMSVCGEMIEREN